MPIIGHIAEFHRDMTMWRRDIHAHPELGLQETCTNSVVQAKLVSFGVDEIITGLARTGVVGVIYGRRKRRRAIGLAPTSMRCRSMKQPGYPTRRNMTA